MGKFQATKILSIQTLIKDKNLSQIMIQIKQENNFQMFKAKKALINKQQKCLDNSKT